MTKTLLIFLIIFSGQIFSQDVNDTKPNYKKLFNNTQWFTTNAFLFCKGDLILQKDSSSTNPLKVLFTNSGDIIINYESKRLEKKYKLNNNLIELNLSDNTTHGIIMYCYNKVVSSDTSIKLIGINKSDFYKK